MQSFLQSLWHLLEGVPPPSDHAEARGYRLLLSSLSPAQRQQFLEHSYFDVVGGDTGTRYRIRDQHFFNVDELDEQGSGQRRQLCFAPAGNLPVGDMMLAQKLALELIESETILIANVASPRELRPVRGAPMPSHRHYWGG
jgi:hypothetical protein